MKRFLKNAGARIQDIFEYLQSLPEHQRMMLAVATMGLAVVTVYGTWFSAASPLANLDLDTANSPKSEDQTPVSAPPVSPAFAADSPASGIIESFKDLETAFLPRANERKFPSVLTAAASWSTILLDWVKTKAWIFLTDLYERIKTTSEAFGIYLSQQFILYTSRTAQ